MKYKGYSIDIVLVDGFEDINGGIRMNKDSSYTIYINANLSCEQKITVFCREYKHIKDRDFDRKDVNEIELRNHGLLVINELSKAN